MPVYMMVTVSVKPLKSDDFDVYAHAQLLGLLMHTCMCDVCMGVVEC